MNGNASRRLSNDCRIDQEDRKLLLTQELIGSVAMAVGLLLSLHHPEPVTLTSTGARSDGFRGL